MAYCRLCTAKRITGSLYFIGMSRTGFGNPEAAAMRGIFGLNFPAGVRERLCPDRPNIEKRLRRGLTG